LSLVIFLLAIAQSSSEAPPSRRRKHQVADFMSGRQDPDQLSDCKRGIWTVKSWEIM
jgi:hypothetical protein